MSIRVFGLPAHQEWAPKGAEVGRDSYNACFEASQELQLYRRPDSYGLSRFRSHWQSCKRLAQLGAIGMPYAGLC